MALGSECDGGCVLWCFMGGTWGSVGKVNVNNGFWRAFEGSTAEGCTFSPAPFRTWLKSHGPKC
jgi:hypothetical protein